MYAIATTTSASLTINAMTAATGLTGRGLIPADLCQYGDVVQPGDVLRVDFDRTSVDKSGLYLIEAINAEGVAWMGCRRFDRGINGVAVDESGRGDWRNLNSLTGLRVAGFVEQVFRAC